MRKVLVILAIIVVVAIILFATGFWQVNQTQEGELPDVNVSAEGGALPEFDVDSKEVVVGTTETNVSVPDVDIETKETTVDVPAVGVKDDGEE
jgi:beta-lactam-binding protein with PASTA domain